MKSIVDRNNDPTPSHHPSRRKWVYGVVALVLLAALVQLGLAVRHYNENAAYVKLLDRAKYGGGMRTTHSTGRVRDAIAVIAETRWGPLPAIGDRLQETWWLLGEPKEIQIAGPGVPLEEALAHVAGSRDIEEVGLFDCGQIDDELDHLAACERLTAIFVRHNTLTPDAFRHIESCEKLERLDLSHSAGVDDDAVAPLKSLSRLKRLDLASTSISDAGLTQLRELRPAFLDLRNTTVGDESIPVLVRMAPQRLRLDGTRFTAEGIAELRRSLPESDIAWTEGD
jgi:hypothetical protein